MRVVCGNCETPFVFKEYEEAHAARSAWEGVVAALEAAVQEADTANEAAIADRERARLEVDSDICVELREGIFCPLWIFDPRRGERHGGREEGGGDAGVVLPSASSLEGSGRGFRPSFDTWPIGDRDLTRLVRPVRHHHWFD